MLLCTSTAWSAMVKICNALGLVYTGDKVEFHTVDFVESRQSQPCHFGPVHTGDKVERTFDIRATNIPHFRQSQPCRTCSTSATMSTASRQRSTLSAKQRQISDKVHCRLWVSVYGPLHHLTSARRNTNWSQ